MTIKTITTTTTAFDLSKVEVGHLIVVRDAQMQLVGSGVVLWVSAWALKCGLYTGEQSWTEQSLEGMDIWRVDINQVVNREFNLIILDPMEILP